MQRSEKPFSGGQLRIARLANCFSLDEMGEKVGVTRQYMHQLESGAKLPNQEMEEALADATGVLSRFFRLTDLAPLVPEQCHFRKQSTTPQMVKSQALARGTVLGMVVDRLDTMLSLPPVSFPNIPVQSAEDIERAAEQCRIEWGLGLTGPITNIIRVAENCGAIVSHFEGVSERVDALSMDRKRPLICRSEAKPAACRLRFDIAHEIGHLVMHQGVQTGDRETEGQAHRFAGALLIPRSVFVREFPSARYLNWQKLEAMKLRWKVSLSAIIRRAHDLQLIGADQYKRAYIHLRKTGQSKMERHDDYIQPEEPELLENALNVLENHQSGSIARLAVSTGLKSEMFELATGLSMPAEKILSTPENVVSLF
ncbi:XRE family transcriptional regulator [Acetobacter persici]|uniref:XRE family transcriptional regulator n=1 Tax=Acetobacter persici TaxID=1076596 RepID=UPI001BAAF3BC|nr:XRE family transcriptional regulator [Acetobacter persici]MBS0962676.1 ImmA/IrrE family metallo-endopeptidase [Acetobacter persici]